MRGHHYLNPKLTGKNIPNKGGHGVFALEGIPPGELLVVWGGNILTYDELEALPERQRLQSIIVEEDAFLVSSEEGFGDWINHSCDPNAWLVGQITLFSRRNILADEEICFDYGTCLGHAEVKFECSCGSLNCRKVITGNDWKKPEIQHIYFGHFMPYLQNRIDS